MNSIWGFCLHRRSNVNVKFNLFGVLQSNICREERVREWLIPSAQRPSSMSPRSPSLSLPFPKTVWADENLFLLFSFSFPSLPPTSPALCVLFSRECTVQALVFPAPCCSFHRWCLSQFCLAYSLSVWRRCNCFLSNFCWASPLTNELDAVFSCSFSSLFLTFYCPQNDHQLHRQAILWWQREPNKNNTRGKYDSCSLPCFELVCSSTVFQSGRS